MILYYRIHIIVEIPWRARPRACHTPAASKGSIMEDLRVKIEELKGRQEAIEGYL